MSLERDEVLRAGAAWLYAPEGAPQVVTEDYRVIAYPPHWADPTIVGAIDSDLDPEALLAEVLAAADSLGRTGAVTFYGLTDATRPPAFEAHLASAGADLSETLAILARGLEELPDLAVPGDLEVLPVDTLERMHDAERVSVAAFGGSQPDDEQAAAALRELAEPTTGQVVAYRDGAPISTGGWTAVGPVLRLWGGATVPEARGTGAYRAVLDARLREGVPHRCRFALVKGRVDTSAPILARAGFAAYGEERAYRFAR